MNHSLLKQNHLGLHLVIMPYLSYLNKPKPLPEALLVGSDDIALGVLKALQEQKIRIP